MWRCQNNVRYGLTDGYPMVGRGESVLSADEQEGCRKMIKLNMRRAVTKISRGIAKTIWPADASRSEANYLLESDLAVEGLEDRCLLSGNVRVIVTAAGDVNVTGDGRSNHVRISVNESNQVVIQGLNDTTGAPTTINGSAAALVIAGTTGGVVGGNLRLNMGGGNDFVEVDGLQISGNFTFSPGGGHDSLGLYHSEVIGLTQMNTGGGNDFVALVDTILHGAWTANFGGGQDFLGLSASNYLTQATIRMTAGLDGFYVADSVLQGNLYLDMGSWPDAIYLAGNVTFNGRFDGNFGSFWDMLGIEQNVVFNGPVNVDFSSGGYWGNQIFTTPGYSVPTGFINVQDINRSSNVATSFSNWITEDSNLNLFHLYVTAHIDRGFDPADLPIEVFGTINFAYIRSSYYYQFFSF